MGAHTTSDDPTKYRTSEEEESWRAPRPDRTACSAYLLGRGASEAFFADVEAECGGGRRRHPRPHDASSAASSRTRCSTHVYSEPHPLVDEQRAWFAEYEASFEEGAS